ncbi:hypothetical protein MCAP1_003557 [Malassezia caprae]|uniref:Transmembrane protein n=1 Tax=Malassezia caprae TaxID=1381934 RepID=A0AAF0EAZ6_9BASI|nr:hypothetical protein MCAP1_003557 [Malassezia caprae]
MAPPVAAQRSRPRRLPWLKPIGNMIMVLFFAWAVIPYLQALVPMLTNTPVARLPDLYVAGHAQCEPVAPTFVADAHGYVRDAKRETGQVPLACEDARLLRGLGVALLSCDPGRIEWNTFLGPLNNPTPRGALWILPYNEKNATAQRLPIAQWPAANDFHPLGLGVYELAPGAARVFVVNQRALFTTIEVLDLVCEQGACHATYVRSLAHPRATHTANSVHPVSPHAVLVTNSHLFARRAPPRAQYVDALASKMPRVLASALYHVVRQPWCAPWLPKVDSLLGLGWVAHVAFDDAVHTPREDAAQYAQGLATHYVAGRLGFANGLGVTPDESALVVASSMYLGTYIYPLRVHDAQGHANWTSPRVLGRRHWAPTPFLPDNVAIVPRAPGAAWAKDDPLHGASVLVAGHPSVAALERMARDGTTRAPSWVVVQSFGRGAPTRDAVDVHYAAERAMQAQPMPSRRVPTRHGTMRMVCCSY